MHTLNKRQVVTIVLMLGVCLLSGCTNWRQRYEYLNVEHENLKGRLQRCENAQQTLAGRISEDQQTIEDLTRQIEGLNRPASQATGFENLDVTWDAAAGTITVTLPNTILFASGKAELKSARNRDLDTITSVLSSKYPGRKVDVVGHTDTDPIKKSGWKDNWELSAERALSVVRYLVKRGVPSSSVRACGCGSARPVGPNSSAAGKARNRRVEIVVHMK